MTLHRIFDRVGGYHRQLPPRLDQESRRVRAIPERVAVPLDAQAFDKIDRRARFHRRRALGRDVYALDGCHGFEAPSPFIGDQYPDSRLLPPSSSLESSVMNARGGPTLRLF